MQFCNKLSTCGFEKQDDLSARDVPKSLLTCRAKLPHEKKWGFQQGPVQFLASFWSVGEGC